MLYKEADSPQVNVFLLQSLTWPSSHTHLIERIYFQSKPIHTWHAADHAEIRQFGSKVGLKGHVMEVLIGYLWLAAVLDFQGEKRDLERWDHWTGQQRSLGRERSSPPAWGCGQGRMHSRSPLLGSPLGTTTLSKGGHLEASVISKHRERGILGK